MLKTVDEVLNSMIYKELLKIADNENIEIVERNFEGNINGLYGQNGDIKVIALDTKLKDDPKKRNFILAHEIGHSILHSKNINPGHIYNKGIDEHEKIEDEANDYANNLIDDIKNSLV